MNPPNATDQLYDDLAYARRLNTELEADNARLRREVEQKRAACVSAITALRARREVEEHTMNAVAYSDCADCCNQRPCVTFAKLEDAAQNAAAQAMADLRAALAPGGEPNE